MIDPLPDFTEGSWENAGFVNAQTRQLSGEGFFKLTVLKHLKNFEKL